MPLHATDDGYPPISDYGFVSDCRSLALVGRDASIEWACFGRFDGSPVFGRILDRKKGGWFRIAPTGEARASRRYLPDTNVLETRFETGGGEVTVTDCLPVHEDPDRPGHVLRRQPEPLLVRVVRCASGSVEVGLDFHPRFEYGLTTPHLEVLGDGLVRVTGGSDMLLLQSDLAAFEPDGAGGGRARQTLSAGDVQVVALTWAPAGQLHIGRLNPQGLFTRVEETAAFWSSWARRCAYQGPHRDAVVRSSLVLKALTTSVTGAVIAAATTSLPEEVGGVRNWDYRFTWVRDAVVLLYTLVSLGHRAASEDFFEWVSHTAPGRAEELQIMYGIGGERMLHERSLDHLDGYRGSRPVRVGNGAWDQFQLDIYGELLAGAWFRVATHEGGLGRLSRFGQLFLPSVVELVIRRWEEPDEGVWETRGHKQHFVFSKLMAWVALDRGIRLFAGTPGIDVERWTAVREAIRAQIESDGVDPESGAFVQAFGSKSLDAATLQLVLRGFLPPTDPRILATIDRIDAELTRNGHVYRYLDRADGLPGEEGTFVFCTLWLASALAMAGRVDEAEQRLQLVLDHANDLGLLAEEIDPVTGEQLGNFPQAFSHAGVVEAALTIDRARRGLFDAIADLDPSQMALRWLPRPVEP